MPDLWKYALAAVLAGALLFLRRGARRAGYDLGRRLRGGREPQPPPRWVVLVLTVVLAAAAVVLGLLAAGVLGGGDGRERARWAVIGAMCVVGVAGGVRELVKERSGPPQ